MKWATTVTTIPERADSLLPRTLESLQRAGFPAPEVLCDAGTLEKRLLPFGNWWRALVHLADREADRFAVFQDDLLACRNVREYLDGCPYPKDGYWNLYSAAGSWKNEGVAGGGVPIGWQPSAQRALGAVGLVFDRESLFALLLSPVIANHRTDPTIGWKKIDWAVLLAMKAVGRKEYVHSPSLLWHTGTESSFDKSLSSTGRVKLFPRYFWPESKAASSFPGEDFDCLELAR